jgi:hypothetical protein
VLEAAARDRQVIVFTHDDRLPEAVRRLGIDAREVEVTRREGSIVQLRAGRDPVSRNIEDAIAVAKTEGLPAVAARRVIPGLCRVAIEAACTEAVRRRRLARGERHADVEGLLAACAGTRTSRLPGPLRRSAEGGRRPPAAEQRVSRLRGRLPAVQRGRARRRGRARIDFIRAAEKLARWLRDRP